MQGGFLLNTTFTSKIHCPRIWRLLSIAKTMFIWSQILCRTFVRVYTWIHSTHRCQDKMAIIWRLFFKLMVVFCLKFQWIVTEFTKLYNKFSVSEPVTTSVWKGQPPLATPSQSVRHLYINYDGIFMSMCLWWTNNGYLIPSHIR